METTKKSISAIPPGWVAAPLQKIVQPRGEKDSPADYPNEVFIGMDHVEAHTTRIIGSVPASDMKSNAARFLAGDVLYGRLRPYLNKVAIPHTDGLASAEFIVFPDTLQLRSGYLKYRLNAADFVSFASHLNEGDRPRVSFDQIGEFEFLLPPHDEQLRIVAKIEQLFSELDKGIESLKTAQEQITVYRQAVLKNAFEGKLTESWREENKDQLEAADDLLERIKVERQGRYEQQLKEWKNTVEQWEKSGEDGRKPAKPKKPAIAGDCEIPQDLTKYCANHWSWLRLSDISEVSGGLTKNQKRRSLPKIMKYLRVANVYKDKLKLDEITEIGVTAEEFRKLQLKVGDLLVVEGNGSIDQIGRLAMWRGEVDEIGHQNHLIRVRLIDSIQSRFVLLYLLSPLGRKFIVKQASSTSGLHTLSITKVSGLPVPVPCVREQEELVSQVDRILSSMQKMESDISDEMKRCDSLRQAIFVRAFSGNLVDQNPSEESASGLLARIKAEKEEQEKSKKASKKKAKKKSKRKDAA